MSVLKKSLIATTLAAALAGLSAAAIAQGMAPELLAQHTAQRMSDAPGPHMHGARHVSMSERLDRMARHRSERLAGLKEALKITPEQEAAWAAFVARTGPAEATGQRMTREDWSKLTTPERLDRMAARKAERDALMTKRMDATRSFYAALTPEQQKIFDERGMGPGMGGHAGYGGGQGHHHGHHGKHHGDGPMKRGMGCDMPPAARS